MAESAFTIETTQLGEADVHVWRAHLDAYGADELAWALLDTDEIGRAQRFRRPVDRDRFVAAHAIVRRVLGAYLGRAPSALRFSLGVYGKPALDVRGRAPALCFNLSHSHDVLLLGVARVDVGIDVERIAGDVEYNELAALVFSVIEQRALAATPLRDRQRAFFIGWTRKEAYIKATGRGVSEGVTHFDVSLEPGAAKQLLFDRRDPAGPKRWTMQDVDVDADYAASLVVAGKGRTVSHRSLSMFESRSA